MSTKWSTSSASTRSDAKVKTLRRAEAAVDLGIALVGDPSSSSSTSRRRGSIRCPPERLGARAPLRELGKTVLLTTHYLDEAQLADRVAVIVAGEIVRIGKPSELIAGTRAQIRYRVGGEEIVLETDEPTRTCTTSPPRRSRTVSSSTGSRCAARRSKTSTSISSRRKSHDAFWHQLKSEQLVFWRSREAAIFVFLFPPLLFVLLASVFGDGTVDGDLTRPTSSPA